MVNRRRPVGNITESFIKYIELIDEWQAPTHTTSDNTTVFARPGAFTFDYRTEFDIGPVELSNVSEGLQSWAWRMDRDGLDFFIARENDDRNGWKESEFLLNIAEVLNETPSEPQQFSFSFDQNGRPLVTFAVDSICYLWWFDPVEGATVIRNLGAGRTPVCILDERRNFNISNSDILIFYINSQDKIVYLRQRDRFNDVFPTPEPADENLNLEILYKSVDTRLVCVFTRFLPEQENYQIGYLTSWTYGLYVQDLSQAKLQLGSFSFRVVNFNGTEKIIPSTNLSNFNFREVIIEENADPEELTSLTLVLDLFEFEASEPVEGETDDSIDLVVTSLDDFNFRRVIVRYIADPEQLDNIFTILDSFTFTD